MIAAINGMRKMWITVVFALLLGIFAMPIYDGLTVSKSADPVVKVQSTIARHDPSNIRIHIKGEKLRECKFLSLEAFLIVDGLPSKLEITRISSAATLPKGLGKFDGGIWEVPVKSSVTGVLLGYSKHDCNGSLVSTVMFEAVL